MMIAEVLPVAVLRDSGKFVIIEPGSAHFLVVELEAEGFYQVQV